MKREKLGQVARGLLGALLIASFIYFIDFSETVSKVLQADIPLYLAAAALFFSSYITISLRWMNLSKSIGIRLRFREAVKIITLSYGFNQLLPGNSGDLARSKIMQNYVEINNHSEVLGTVALERFYDALMVTLLLLVSASFLAPSYTQPIQWLIILFSVLIAGFITAVLVSSYLEFELWLLPEAVSDKVELFVDGVKSTSASKTLENLLLTSYKWVAEVAVMYILASSLSISLGIWEVALVTSSMSLISALPITPAGIGPVEITGTLLLKASGAVESSAASLVILQRSIGVVLSALLGLVVYLKDFRSLSRKPR